MIKSFLSAALVSGMLLGVTPAVSADTSGDEQLRAEVAELRARLAQLETSQKDTWLTERRAEEVKGLVREVLADADTRASLMEHGVAAGHDGESFFLSSADGAYLLRVGGQIQFRYVYNHREGANSAGPLGTDDDVAGFELSRTKLFFSGHVGSPKLTYAIGLQADNGTETIFLDHAFIGYQWMDGMTIYGGESKAPFLREEMVSSSKQLAVERSLMNEFFTMGKVQGVWLVYEPGDNYKAYLALTDGAGSGEAGDAFGLATATKNFFGDASDFSITGRLDWRLEGEWSQWQDFSSWSGSGRSILLGAAVHYQVAETGDDQFSSPGVDEFVAWTVDGSFKQSGASLYVAAVGLHTGGASPVTGGDNYGVVAQAAYMVVPDELEPFVRWEYINPAFASEVNIVTAGANYYMNHHKAKATVDLMWVPGDTLSGIGGSTAVGLLTDAPGEENQVAFRAQFQMLF